MVAMCIVATQLMLTAITPDLVRLCGTKCKATDGAEEWTFQTNTAFHGDRICNLKYGTCIGLAHDRKIQSCETLVLLPPGDTNVLYWAYIEDKKALHLGNNTRFYMDIQNDQKVDMGPIQLIDLDGGTPTKFTIETC